MIYLSKKNGSIYYKLDENIIDFHINELNSLIVCVNDERQFIKNEFGEIIDNFVLEELREGLNEVKKVLSDANDELLIAYLNFYIENINNETEALEVKKELKKREITRKRDEAINGGVEYKGKVFQSSEKDRNLLTSTISLFSITQQVPEGFTWISKDNEFIPFTLQELIELGGLMANSVSINTVKARKLKNQINNAQTLEEVKNITWDNETVKKTRKR